MASEKQTIVDTSVINLEAVGDDQSDYDVDLSDPHQPSSRRRHASGGEEDEGMGFMKITKGEMASGVASYVWEEGRQRAKKAFSIYGNIDILRPYFDVEPHTVRNRLIHSLVPKLPRTGSQEKVPRELYGPTMVVLTLIALLLFQMKMSGHTVQEGTLMGSAFGVCFTYWFGASGLLWFLSYVCNTHITSLQILSLMGYALFGHCVALFLGTTFHPSHSHFFFYVLWLVFGGLSTLRVVSILYSRTSGRTQRIVTCGVIAALHMLFLLYLHFAYHKIVTDLDYALDGNRIVPQAIGPGQPMEAMKVKRELDMPVVHDNVQTTAKIAVTFKQLVREVNKRAISETVRQAVTPSALSKLRPVKPRQDLGTAVKHLLNGTHNAVHNGTVRQGDG